MKNSLVVLFLTAVTLSLGSCTQSPAIVAPSTLQPFELVESPEVQAKAERGELPVGTVIYSAETMRGKNLRATASGGVWRSTQWPGPLWWTRGSIEAEAQYYRDRGNTWCTIYNMRSRMTFLLQWTSYADFHCGR